MGARVIDARVLQRGDAELQHQALLRVEHHGLARGDAEVRGVEALDVIERAMRGHVLATAELVGTYEKADRSRR